MERILTLLFLLALNPELGTPTALARDGDSISPNQSSAMDLKKGMAPSMKQLDKNAQIVATNGVDRAQFIHQHLTAAHYLYQMAIDASNHPNHLFNQFMEPATQHEFKEALLKKLRSQPDMTGSLERGHNQILIHEELQPILERANRIADNDGRSTFLPKDFAAAVWERTPPSVQGIVDAKIGLARFMGGGKPKYGITAQDLIQSERSASSGRSAGNESAPAQIFETPTIQEMRTDWLRKESQIIQRAMERRGSGVVVITGQDGSGKSRLIQQALLDLTQNSDYRPGERTEFFKLNMEWVLTNGESLEKVMAQLREARKTGKIVILDGLEGAMALNAPGEKTMDANPLFKRIASMSPETRPRMIIAADEAHRQALEDSPFVQKATRIALDRGGEESRTVEILIEEMHRTLENAGAESGRYRIHTAALEAVIEAAKEHLSAASNDPGRSLELLEAVFRYLEGLRSVGFVEILDATKNRLEETRSLSTEQRQEQSKKLETLDKEVARITSVFDQTVSPSERLPQYERLLEQLQETRARNSNQIERIGVELETDHTQTRIEYLDGEIQRIKAVINDLQTNQDHSIKKSQTEKVIITAEMVERALVFQYPEVAEKVLSAKQGIAIDQLETEMNKVIIGQPEAVAIFHEYAQAYKGGKGSRTKGTMGNFFLAGPAGVGKTESAVQLAKLLFGTDDALIRFNGGDFKGKYGTSKIVGADPGTTGHEPGKTQTIVDYIRKAGSRGIIFFDEIEKAETPLFEFLLPVLQDGQFVDSFGRKADASGYLFVFTSNAAQELKSKIEQSVEAQVRIWKTANDASALHGFADLGLEGGFWTREEHARFLSLAEKEGGLLIFGKESFTYNIDQIDFLTKELLRRAITDEYGRPIKKEVIDPFLDRMSALIHYNHLKPEVLVNILESKIRRGVQQSAARRGVDLEVSREMLQTIAEKVAQSKGGPRQAIESLEVIIVRQAEHLFREGIVERGQALLIEFDAKTLKHRFYTTDQATLLKFRKATPTDGDVVQALLKEHRKDGGSLAQEIHNEKLLRDLTGYRNKVLKAFFRSRARTQEITIERQKQITAESELDAKDSRPLQGPQQPEAEPEPLAKKQPKKSNGKKRGAAHAGLVSLGLTELPLFLYETIEKAKTWMSDRSAVKDASVYIEAQNETRFARLTEVEIRAEVRRIAIELVGNKNPRQLNMMLRRVEDAVQNYTQEVEGQKRVTAWGNFGTLYLALYVRAKMFGEDPSHLLEAGTGLELAAFGPINRFAEKGLAHLPVLRSPLTPPSGVLSSSSLAKQFHHTVKHPAWAVRHAFSMALTMQALALTRMIFVEKQDITPELLLSMTGHTLASAGIFTMGRPVATASVVKTLNFLRRYLKGAKAANNVLNIATGPMGGVKMVTETIVLFLLEKYVMTAAISGWETASELMSTKKALNRGHQKIMGALQAATQENASDDSLLAMTEAATDLRSGFTQAREWAKRDYIKAIQGFFKDRHELTKKWDDLIPDRLIVGRNPWNEPQFKNTDLGHNLRNQFLQASNPPGPHEASLVQAENAIELLLDCYEKETTFVRASGLIAYSAEERSIIYGEPDSGQKINTPCYDAVDKGISGWMPFSLLEEMQYDRKTFKNALVWSVLNESGYYDAFPEGVEQAITTIPVLTYESARNGTIPRTLSGAPVEEPRFEDYVFMAFLKDQKEAALLEQENLFYASSQELREKTAGPESLRNIILQKQWNEAPTYATAVHDALSGKITWKDASKALAGYSQQGYLEGSFPYAQKKLLRFPKTVAEGFLHEQLYLELLANQGQQLDLHQPQDAFSPRANRKEYSHLSELAQDLQDELILLSQAEYEMMRIGPQKTLAPSTEAKMTSSTMELLRSYIQTYERAL